MKIKSQEWLEFKNKVIRELSVVEAEIERFDFPFTEEGDFVITVDDCNVHPVFVNKGGVMKVEYDFSLCNTKIRFLSFSTHFDATRIEVTLKKGIDG